MVGEKDAGFLLCNVLPALRNMAARHLPVKTLRRANRNGADRNELKPGRLRRRARHERPGNADDRCRVRGARFDQRTALPPVAVVAGEFSS